MVLSLHAHQSVKHTIYSSYLNGGDFWFFVVKMNTMIIRYSLAFSILVVDSIIIEPVRWAIQILYLWSLYE